MKALANSAQAVAPVRTGLVESKRGEEHVEAWVHAVWTAMLTLELSCVCALELKPSSPLALLLLLASSLLASLIPERRSSWSFGASHRRQMRRASR